MVGSKSIRKVLSLLSTVLTGASMPRSLVKAMATSPVMTRVRLKCQVIDGR